MTQLKYTDEQTKLASQLFLEIEAQIQIALDRAANNFATTHQLVNDPEALDKILNLHRLKNICFAYLVAPWTSSIGHHLEDENSSTIDDFLANKDANDLITFFSQAFIIDDYIKENELDLTNCFANDSVYQQAYAKFLS